MNFLYHRTFRSFKLVVILLLITSSNLFSQSKVNGGVKISSDSAMVGERVLLNTKFTVNDGEKIKVIPYSETLQAADTVTRVGNDTLLTDLSKLEVLRELYIDTLSAKKGVRELEAKVIVTSFDTGIFRLPDPQIVVGSDTAAQIDLSFNDRLLTISTIQVDTTGFVMADIRGQITYPVTFNEVFPWILLVLSVLLVAYLIYRYIKYKRLNKNFFGREKVMDPPHIVALRELEHIRNEKLWQAGKEKQYYTGITDTLRDYIERSFNLSAKEKTSNEILTDMKGVNVDKKSFEELSNLLYISDLVKFAKYTPSTQENEEAVPIAVRFVNSTFMTQMMTDEANTGAATNANVGTTTKAGGGESSSDSRGGSADANVGAGVNVGADTYAGAGDNAVGNGEGDIAGNYNNDINGKGE